MVLYYFLTQTFFLGGTCPKCPSYHSKTLYRKLVLHPPTPYTLSPLLKGGEGRGEGRSYTCMPCPFGTRLVTLYYFLAQTFFLGGTYPKCPSYHSKTLYRKLVLHPPTPYTLSPLLKGGEGRGEGGSYTRMPCPFGTRLVTLYYFLAQTFFLGGTYPKCPSYHSKTLYGNWSYIPPLPTPSPPFSRGERVGVRGDRTPVCRVPSTPAS
jgi:hypothetical protein